MPVPPSPVYFSIQLALPREAPCLSLEFFLFFIHSWLERDLRWKWPRLRHCIYNQHSPKHCLSLTQSPSGLSDNKMKAPRKPPSLPILERIAVPLKGGNKQNQKSAACILVKPLSQYLPLLICLTWDQRDEQLRYSSPFMKVYLMLLSKLQNYLDIISVGFTRRSYYMQGKEITSNLFCISNYALSCNLTKLTK